MIVCIFRRYGRGMAEPVAVSAIAHQIQLAVTPVFLLAGIGALLGVLTSRLARIFERSRSLEQDYDGLDEEIRSVARAELLLLDQRMGVINVAITCCTAAALFVCVLVAMMFLANLLDVGFGRAIAWLFILAMLLLIVGLLTFLWEIRLAIKGLRVRRDRMPHRRA